MREETKSAKAKKAKGTATVSPSAKEPVGLVPCKLERTDLADLDRVLQTHVEDRHLRKSLQSTRPSVPDEELARLRKM